MKIHVASMNPKKIKAVMDLVPEYPILNGASVSGVLVDTGVSDQPKTLEETIQGAMNRAKAAFGDANYSFGIESGLMAVPHTKTGVMDVCVCAIYDGTEFHLGISSAWEPPKLIAKLMHDEGLDMSQACHKAGLSASKNIGAEEGVIGIVTKGRIDRLAYTKQAVMMALIHLENQNLFAK